MKKILMLTLVVAITSCALKLGSYSIKETNFKGKVVLPAGKNKSYVHTLKAELTVMKQDSTIIKRFITNPNGTFDEVLKINSKWNPVIVKIKSLSRIDNIAVSIRNQLFCSETKEIFQNINFDESEFFKIIFECQIDNSKNKEIVTKEFLKGKWEVYNSNTGKLNYSGSNSIYTFTDSTYSNITYFFSDQVAMDSCSEIVRYYYSAGKYSIKESLLELEGAYTDRTFKELNKNSCKPIGQFTRAIEMYRVQDTLFIAYKINPNINYAQVVKFLKK